MLYFATPTLGFSLTNGFGETLVEKPGREVGDLSRLPVSLRVLMETCCATRDGIDRQERPTSQPSPAG